MPHKSKQNPLKHEHNGHKPKPRYKLCVSGAAVDISGPESFRKAYELGQIIAKSGAVLVTGATTGTPFEAAHGAKDAGGFVIGLSPASSKSEHVNKYKLPLDFLDLVIYTGFNYSGRNLLLTRASDAVFFVSGRIGTLNEFTIAFEDKKPIGVLTGTGGIIDELDDILAVARRGAKNIVFDSDPARLVKKVMKLVKAKDEQVVKIDRRNHIGHGHRVPAPQTSVPE